VSLTQVRTKSLQQLREFLKKLKFGGILPLFLFIYFTLIGHTYRNFVYCATRREQSWSPDCIRSVEDLLWGAEPKFELGPGLQQADSQVATVWVTPHPFAMWGAFNTSYIACSFSVLNGALMIFTSFCQISAWLSILLVGLQKILIGSPVEVNDFWRHLIFPNRIYHRPQASAFIGPSIERSPLAVKYVVLLIHPPHCKYSLLNPLYNTGVKHRI
jgi:hypothetical protein